MTINSTTDSTTNQTIDQTQSSNTTQPSSTASAGGHHHGSYLTLIMATAYDIVKGDYAAEAGLADAGTLCAKMQYNIANVNLLDTPQWQAMGMSLDEYNKWLRLSVMDPSTCEFRDLAKSMGDASLTRHAKLWYNCRGITKHLSGGRKDPKNDVEAKLKQLNSKIDLNDPVQSQWLRTQQSKLEANANSAGSETDKSLNASKGIGDDLNQAIAMLSQMAGQAFAGTR